MESLINIWQQLPFYINPALFSIGAFQLRYYSLMYLVGFVIVYMLTVYRIKHENYDYQAEMLQDCMIWAMFAMIIGARLGEVLIYNFGYFVHHPLEIFLPFSFSNGIHFTGISGMSYHGGLIGVFAGAWFFCKKKRLEFWKLIDFVIPAAPAGLSASNQGV